MKPADIVLAHISDTQGSLQQLGTGSRWGHAYTSVATDAFLNPQIPTIQVVRGVLVDGPDQRTIPVDLTDSERALVAAKAAELIGKPYSLRAVLWLAACRLVPPLGAFHDPLDSHGWVCSTVATWAYDQCGLLSSLKVPAGRTWDSIIPADLAEWNGLA